MCSSDLIVVNRNTIPGDKSALRASGLRIGLPCVTQIGLKEADMVELGNIIADLMYATQPYSTYGAKGMLLRAKVDFKAFQASSGHSVCAEAVEPARLVQSPTARGWAPRRPRLFRTFPRHVSTWLPL